MPDDDVSMAAAAQFGDTGNALIIANAVVCKSHPLSSNACNNCT